MKFALRAQRNLSRAVLAIFSGSKCPTFYCPFLIASQRWCVVVMLLFWYRCVIWWVRKMFVYITNGLTWRSARKITLITILEVPLIIETLLFLFGENNVKIIYVFCTHWNAVLDICRSFHINLEMTKLGLV